MRHLIASTLAVAALATAVESTSAAVWFDPAGTGNATVQYTAVDVAPGNVLLTNIVPTAITGYSSEFDLYYQARVQALLDSNGLPIYYPGGNRPELTVIAGFHGAMAQVGPSTVAVLLPGLPNFVSVYSDVANNANDLAGTGFSDGTLIYSGLATTGMGSMVNSGAITPLDSFGTNNYPGVNALAAAGGVEFSGVMLTADPLYFANPASMLLVDVSSTLSSPFIAANPSALFTNGSSAIAVGPLDLRLQADGNLTFVPEPASLGLLALGAGALLRRRR
jgi:hypothetical protein